MVDVVGLVRLLLLVRRRALQPAHGRDGAQEPGQFRVLGPVTLDEQRAALRIEAQGQERCGHLERPLAQEHRIVRARERVVVDDAVDRLVFPLQDHVVADGPEIVAEVDDPGRLDAAEDPGPLHRRRLERRGWGELGGHERRVYPSEPPPRLPSVPMDTTP